MAQAAYLAMKFYCEFLNLPVMASKIVIGIVESIGHAMGLFRHYCAV